MKIQLPKKRVTWGFNPVSRTISSDKRYMRAKEKDALRRRNKLQNTYDVFLSEQ